MTRIGAEKLALIAALAAVLLLLVANLSSLIFGEPR
jgi:hypothetical protein